MDWLRSKLHSLPFLGRRCDLRFFFGVFFFGYVSCGFAVAGPPVVLTGVDAATVLWRFGSDNYFGTGTCRPV
jgi:hypothetical protein